MLPGDLPVCQLKQLLNMMVSELFLRLTQVHLNALYNYLVDWIGYVLKVDSFKKKEVMSTLSYQKILTKSTVESDKV